MWVASLLFGSIVTQTTQAEAKQDAPPRLKFVLVLTRHGVRSPTWTNARLDEYARAPWPKWSVEPGELTSHGKLLMKQFGAFYRASFAKRGLLSRDGCADAGSVYIYGDTDHRTVDTEHSLADGLFPGCNIEVHSLAAGTQDVLFHASGRLGRPDVQLAFSAVSGRVGGDLAALLPAYRAPLEVMQQVLLGCAEANCAGENRKRLLDVTPSLAPGSGDHLVEMKGPLNTAATFAENFQLEYLEGMPAEQVGWGWVNERNITALMALHAASSDLIQRTPYVARVQSSNLLFHILRTLEQAEQDRAIEGAVGPLRQKAVFLAGHDTNISNIAALLDVHWLINGYQRDDAAPGGALVFELWQRPGREDTVRVYYTVQSPAQMRNAVPLSLAEPPARTSLFLPGCSRAEEDSPCIWDDFEHLAKATIDQQFAK
jgi:4-phytase/acid phosphatase